MAQFCVVHRTWSTTGIFSYFHSPHGVVAVFRSIRVPNRSRQSQISFAKYKFHFFIRRWNFHLCILFLKTENENVIIPIACQQAQSPAGERRKAKPSGGKEAIIPSECFFLIIAKIYLPRKKNQSFTIAKKLFTSWFTQNTKNRQFAKVISGKRFVPHGRLLHRY